MCNLLWNAVIFSSYPKDVKRPSWYEVKYFVQFFNTQLKDFEENIWGSRDPATMKENETVLPGFSTFVIEFLKVMSEVKLTY